MDRKKSGEDESKQPATEFTEFTEDPLNIEPVQSYSQIPTPTQSLDENGTGRTSNSPKHDETANGNGEDKKKKEENNMSLKNENERGDAKLPLTKHGKAAVSKAAMSGERDAESLGQYDERMPLLLSCSSLPTVVDFDNASIVQSDVAGPLHHTQSEIGRDEIAKKKKKKSKRRRCVTDRIGAVEVRPKAVRPWIPSSFMPIPSEIGDTIDRRASLLGSRGRSLTREAARTPAGYGSMRRTEQQRHVGKTPPDEESQPSPSPCSSSTSEEESSSEMDESVTDESITLLNKSSFFSLNSREWTVIVMMALANLCSTVAFSCIAPFYPGEAALKQLSESQVGIVFGVFEFVMFISAPLFGKYMVYIGSKLMFVIGLTITGVTAILFGFLNFLPPGQIFFWASLIVRVLEAIGDAAFVTSSFAISAKCFPSKISLVIGLLETFAGLGYTAGPVIGGFLYEFGGFQLPFLVLGIILLLATVLSLILIEKQDDTEDSSSSKGMMQMLAIPRIWLMVYAVFVCAVSLSFLDPTLSAHLAPFKLSPTMVGVFFLLCGGIYTLSAPLWGIIIDRYHNSSTLLMLFGSFATLVSMLLIGPSPLLSLDKNLFIIGVSLSVLGIAAGALYIPTFQSCLDIVKLHGYEDSFKTYGAVSGVFQSAFALGAFSGPTLGGFSVEKIGFEWTTTIISGIHVLFIICLLVFEFIDYFCLRPQNQPAASLSVPTMSPLPTTASAIPNNEAVTV